MGDRYLPGDAWRTIGGHFYTDGSRQRRCFHRLHRDGPEKGYSFRGCREIHYRILTDRRHDTFPYSRFCGLRAFSRRFKSPDDRRRLDRISPL